MPTLAAMERCGWQYRSTTKGVVVVTDEGIGVRGFTASRRADAGLGLGLIRALANRVRIEPGSDGTLVEMAFARG
jgi:hypothetical protein